MTQELVAGVKDLLRDRNHAYVATVSADGWPHVVPTWVDENDGDVVLNSAEGRRWVRSLQQDGRIACLVHDRDDPSHYLLVRGEVTGFGHAGADEHFTAGRALSGDRRAEPGRRRTSHPYPGAPGRDHLQAAGEP